MKNYNRFPGFPSFKSMDDFDEEFERSRRRINIFGIFVAGFVALGFLLVIGGALLRVTGVTPARTRARAEVLARNYAINVNRWNDPYVQCAGVDNGNDGYVTCMISDRAGATAQIECADQGITDQMNNICRPYNTINVVNGGNVR